MTKRHVCSGIYLTPTLPHTLAPMTEVPRPDSHPVPEEQPGVVYGYGPYPILVLRSIIGGVFMGLASIVPGVSGGTMIAAAGIYPFVLEGIADVSRLRLARRSVFVLSVVFTSAFAAVLLFAPWVRALMFTNRYLMFALFSGLAWGGVPVVYSMARPTTRRVFVSAAVAFVVVVALTSLRELSDRPVVEHVGFAWFFIGGVIAAAAMILPGVSAAYILVLLGVYGPLMDAVDALRNGYSSGDLATGIHAAMPVFLPMGLGVVLGLLGVANLFKRLLYEAPKVTLGALLGLLVGALVTLWPFQRMLTPEPGAIVNGRVMTQAMIDTMPLHSYPVEYFMPTLRETLMASAVFFLACMLTVLVARFTVRSGESGFDAAARSQG